MPDPLAMPPTVTGPLGVSITAAHDFGNGSVVMIARVASDPPSIERASAAAVTPAFTLSRFSGTPITPVEETKMNSSAHPRACAAAEAMPFATARPASPVQALAQPLLTTAPAHKPSALVRWSRETIIGAAIARFVVNTAAAGTGPFVDTSRHRSRGSVAAFGFLMPQ